MNESAVSMPGRARPWPRITPVRVGAGLVFLGLAIAGGAWLWQLRYRGELPDVGDPFDVDAARRPIPITEKDNAYAAYADAFRKFIEPSRDVRDLLGEIDGKVLVWSQLDPRIHDLLEKNRAALEIWREGSERSDAVYHQPGNSTASSMLPLVEPTALLAHLALIEASRRSEHNEMELAWAWYRSAVRCSRLIGRHGFPILRLRGAWIHEQAAPRIVRWAADSRVDARLLRQALTDTLAADALTAPVSDMLKIEYLMCVRELEEPDLMLRELEPPWGNGTWFSQRAPVPVRLGLSRMWLRAANDSEKSQRALKILFANWLAQADRLPAERAPVAIEKPTLIYAADPSAPPGASAVAPEQLSAAIDHTALARLMFHHDKVDGDWPPSWSWENNYPLARERRRRAALIVIVAAELYGRERGFLPTKAGDLIGTYLKRLPEGTAASDPIPAKAD